MATWIVGGILLLAVAGIVTRMVRDHRAGKGTCSCGGDCSKCRGCH